MEGTIIGTIEHYRGVPVFSTNNFLFNAERLQAVIRFMNNMELTDSRKDNTTCRRCGTTFFMDSKTNKPCPNCGTIHISG